MLLVHQHVGEPNEDTTADGGWRILFSFDAQWPTRHGNYFWSELTPNNSTGAVWLTITNLAVRPASTNTDYAATNIGHLFLPQTPETFGYDLDGNLTNDGRWTFTWDAENRLTKIESRTDTPVASKKRLAFTYDAQWRRTQKIVYTNNASNYVAQYTNRFIYDGWNLVAVLDGGNNLLQSFVWGTDLSGTMQGAGGVGGLVSTTVHEGANAGTYFYAYDGNGNVVALVNAANGSVVARYEYSPFGEVIRATGTMARVNPFRFSTKYQDDETDLLYYGYRYYSANTGRWLNQDPIEERGGLNLYGFVGNDGINDSDFAGLRSWGTCIRQKVFHELKDNNNVNSIFDLGLNSLLDSSDANFTGGMLSAIQNDPAMRALDNRVIGMAREKANSALFNSMSGGCVRISFGGVG